MKWNVRVESESTAETLQAFLKGVWAGLLGAGLCVSLVQRHDDAPLDIEFLLPTEQLAIDLATTITEDLERDFVDAHAQVTLTVDVRRMTGGAA